MKQEDEVLHHANMRGASVFIALMFIFFTVTTIHGMTMTPGARILNGVFAFGLLCLAVAAHGQSETVYADRLEFTNVWRRKPEVIPFSKIDRVALRSNHNGLRLEIHAGKRKLRWETEDDSRRYYKTEPVIKCIHDALIAAGVEIDSLNRMRNGPFTAWVHTKQPSE